MEDRQPSKLEQVIAQDQGNTILSELNAFDYVNLKRTNFSLSQFFNKFSLSYLLNRFVYFLAQAPDDNGVRFILESNRPLLKKLLVDHEFKEVKLKKRTVTNVTALQLVYGAKDGEMCGTLSPFFAELYGSVEASSDEVQRQINEMKDEHKPFNFQPIMHAILMEAFNNGRDPQTNKLILSQATIAAIDKFRLDFDTSQPKVINKGMQFRWETLQDLGNAYAEAAAQLGWRLNKSKLVEDVVLAWVLGYLPENGKQHCNQGLDYLRKYFPEPFRRMQNTYDGKNFDEALSQQSVDFLLNSSCVDIIAGVSARIGGSGACYGNPDVWSKGVAEVIAELVSHNNVKLSEFIQQHSRTETPWFLFY